MPGAIHDAINDIKVIANTLRDLYKSGFPVLKEIIQNADDAGANQLFLGWSEGLSNAEHPLLADPSIFFINNAPLKNEDVKGIMSIALGAKTDDKKTVGKFGLGMKSLFHLGEVFFFMANNWRSVPENANVFNPWADYRKHWDSFSEHDKELIEVYLSELTKKIEGENNFIVWIPLRSQKLIESDGEQEGVIIKGKNYGKHIPDFLSDDNLSDQIAQLIPLLKYLNNVQLFTIKSNQVNNIFSVSLKKDSGRIAYGQEKNPQNWNGRISIEHSENSLLTRLFEYAGNEVILDQEPFISYKKHTDWPSSFGRKGLVEIQIPDKAEPHAAVVIMKKPALNQATLNIRWAVFLPLGEQDISQSEQSYSTHLNGEYCYDILLHGYFFIDAGRVGIHGQRRIGIEESIEINNEEDLICEWNRNLANQGTLPCLIYTLNSLAYSFKFNKNEIETLSKGIKDFINNRKSLADLSPWITHNYQWLYYINKQNIEWKIVDSNQAVRLIPPPRDNAIPDDYQRIWTTFPELSNLSENFILAEANRPNLLSLKNRKWKTSEISSLLNIDIENVFSTQLNLKYLNKFLKFIFEENHLTKVELKLFYNESQSL